MFDGASIARETSREYKAKPNWEAAHAELKKLADQHATQDYVEAVALLAAYRTRAHEQLGFGSFIEYIDRLFGWPARLTKEKLRVAEALQYLPELAQALRDSVLNWSTVRELSRVAIKETEGEWLDKARGRSVREVERLISGRERGDRPNDKRKPELKKQILHAEVSGETMALFREALKAVQKTAGEPLSEDQAIAMIARAALGGPKEDGRANYQIVVTQCADCKRTTQRGRGEEIEVDAMALEIAECDAQRIDLRTPEAPASQDIPPATRRFIKHRDSDRCLVPGCAHSTFLDIHHLTPRSEGGTHDPDRMGSLCGAHHTQVHEGRLIIEGRASTGLTFKHADGTIYGGNVDAKLSGRVSDAFEALVALEFKQGEARRALDYVLTHVGHEAIDSTETLVKMALRYLSKNASCA